MIREKKELEWIQHELRTVSEIHSDFATSRRSDLADSAADQRRK
jgi:hypothetical protein